MRAITIAMTAPEVPLELSQLTLADLADEYGDQLYRFCLKLTYCKEDAEDLFQETFLRALTQLPKINNSNNPKGFLFSAAVYLWKSSKRKYARRNRIAPVYPLDEKNEDLTLVSGGNLEDDFMAEESARIVRELVHSLPDKYKVPVIMRYTAEMELSEIAAALRLPTGTVKSRLHKARKIIEKGLVKIGYEN